MLHPPETYYGLSFSSHTAQLCTSVLSPVQQTINLKTGARSGFCVADLSLCVHVRVHAAKSTEE